MRQKHHAGTHKVSQKLNLSLSKSEVKIPDSPPKKDTFYGQVFSKVIFRSLIK